MSTRVEWGSKILKILLIGHPQNTLTILLNMAYVVMEIWHIPSPRHVHIVK